jgi:hypothetical protein
MTTLLATDSLECARLFGVLSSIRSNSSVPPLQCAMEDQYARFQIWAGNLGAFHRLPSELSLDYRLKNSRRISDHVKSLLFDLIATLKDGEPRISSGRHSLVDKDQFRI